MCVRQTSFVPEISTDIKIFMSKSKMIEGQRCHFGTVELDLILKVRALQKVDFARFDKIEHLLSKLLFFEMRKQNCIKKTFLELIYNA